MAGEGGTMKSCAKNEWVGNREFKLIHEDPLQKIHARANPPSYICTIKPVIFCWCIFFFFTTTVKCQNSKTFTRKRTLFDVSSLIMHLLVFDEKILKGKNFFFYLRKYLKLVRKSSKK